MYLFFDESGNLGNPKEKYCVIGGLLTTNYKRIRGVMRRATSDVRREFSNLRYIPELKAALCPPIAKDYILRKLAKEDIQVYMIVVDNNHIKPANCRGKDKNRFVNYLMGLLVCRIVRDNPFTQYRCLIDEQNIRVGSLNSFEDYINIKLIYELGQNAAINVKYGQSDQFFELQAADFLCNAFWGKYNHPNTDYFSGLIDSSKVTELVFPLSYFGK